MADAGADAAVGPLSRLVHDLRSPLTVVEGFAHLLERDDEKLNPDQRADYARRIRDAACDMRRLLDALPSEFPPESSPGAGAPPPGPGATPPAP